jgi:hypothetical protein
MPSSGMLRRVALVRTDVSEELNASIIRVTRIGELGSTLAVRLLLATANVILSSLIIITLIMEALRSSETSVLTRATRRNIPEDGILLHLSMVTEQRGLCLAGLDKGTYARFHGERLTFFL